MLSSKNKDHLEWNSHLNDNGMKDVLLLQKKAKDYFVKEVKTHLPKINSNKQLELQLRLMKMEM